MNIRNPSSSFGPVPNWHPRYARLRALARKRTWRKHEKTMLMMPHAAAFHNVVPQDRCCRVLNRRHLAPSQMLAYRLPSPIPCNQAIIHCHSLGVQASRMHAAGCLAHRLVDLTPLLTAPSSSPLLPGGVRDAIPSSPRFFIAAAVAMRARISHAALSGPLHEEDAWPQRALQDPESLGPPAPALNMQLCHRPRR